jgi:hypothetical protein
LRGFQRGLDRSDRSRSIGSAKAIFSNAGAAVANLTGAMIKVAPLVLILNAMALPAFGQNWSVGGGFGPFVFGRFAERTVVINNETSSAKTTSRLSAATRAGLSADMERNLNDRFAIRLDASWVQAPLRLKSSSGGTGVTLDSGQMNLTTFSAPLIIRLNPRGTFRFHVMGGPAYALYKVHRQTAAGSLPLFDGTRGRLGVVTGGGVGWWLSSRFGVEWQLADIVTSSPFRGQEIAATQQGVHITRPQNGYTTLGIRYRF